MIRRAIVGNQAPADDDTYPTGERHGCGDPGETWGGVARAGRRFGLNARVVPMSDAEACIDADKPSDVTLIERILAQRG